MRVKMESLEVYDQLKSPEAAGRACDRGKVASQHKKRFDLMVDLKPVVAGTAKERTVEGGRAGDDPYNRTIACICHPSRRGYHFPREHSRQPTSGLQ
jgi:hypothetical protein